MIQPQELRKGNIIGRYFHNPNPKGATKEVAIGVVMEIREESVNMTAKLGRKERIKLPYESLTPIELTEEWLIKLGYKKDEFEIFSTQSKLFIYPMENINSFKATWRGSSIGEIKTVNHLQNLFYFLTGKELTIKE